MRRRAASQATISLPSLGAVFGQVADMRLAPDSAAAYTAIESLQKRGCRISPGEGLQDMANLTLAV